MSLSKIFTVGNVVKTVLLTLKQADQGELEPELVKNFANLAVFEIANEISKVTTDYGKTSDVTDASTNVSTSVVTGANYANATKLVTKASHGLTSNDVGKRIILIISGRYAIFNIAHIYTANTFSITGEFGVSVVDDTLSYVVLSNHSNTTIDLSSLQIMNITKLYSSTLKEIPMLEEVEADNIHRNDFKVVNKAFWFQHGEYIFITNPESVSLGTLKLFYNEYPSKKTSDSEYFDIRDNYIPQVIKRTVEICIEHLKNI